MTQFDPVDNVGTGEHVSGAGDHPEWGIPCIQDLKSQVVPETSSPTKSGKTLATKRSTPANASNVTLHLP